MVDSYKAQNNCINVNHYIVVLNIASMHCYCRKGYTCSHVVHSWEVTNAFSAIIFVDQFSSRRIYAADLLNKGVPNFKGRKGLSWRRVALPTNCLACTSAFPSLFPAALHVYFEMKALWLSVGILFVGIAPANILTGLAPLRAAFALGGGSEPRLAQTYNGK